MSDGLTIDVDASGLLRMLDQLGEAVEKHVLEASRETGRRIADEARGRVARRTGKTAAAITVTDDGKSVRVFVGPVAGRSVNVPLFLEFGTKYMSARPFLFASARLEEGAHLRRVQEAVQAAIDEVTS